jgi:hypothetical protein
MESVWPKCPVEFANSLVMKNAAALCSINLSVHYRLLLLCAYALASTRRCGITFTLMNADGQEYGVML